MAVTGRFPPVVVGVDGSPAADAAAHEAADEAHRRLLPLRLVHAFDWPAAPGTGPAPGRAAARRAASAHLWSVQEAVLAEHPGTPVSAAVVDGRAAEVLLAEAAGAELLVLGAHGTGPLAGVLGPVRAAVVRGCPCPVLSAAARRPGPGPRGPVVAALGGDQRHDSRLLAAAVLEAGTCGTGLTVVDLRHDPAGGEEPDPRLAALVGQLRQTAPGVPVYLTRSGGPALSGSPTAGDAALLVVGRGRPDQPLDATVRAALGQAEVPVLVVPSAPVDRGRSRVRALAAAAHGR
ncbi:universal stress protein [Modestobacter sp. SSW1-42]|uniref:universal stress protein n=1 Tax=Modestobacter sp. SSW1-42 TaxID=596372 RepID=UPI003987CEF9